MIDQRKHIVIIGSGLGGLICGRILIKNGYRITVLEQHHTAGGCLQSFVRGGVKFDTGMHYIGSMNVDGALRKFWRYLGLENRIKLEELDRDGFDVIDIDGKEYKYSVGYENFVELLAQQFPDQRENLKRYVEKIKDIASQSIFFGKYTSIENLMDNSHLKISINRFLDEIITDDDLKNVLIGNNLLFAGEKNKTPIYINALINSSYIEGAYRIVGGSDQIAKVLCEQIASLSGEVRTRAKAVKIKTEDKVVRSVLLSDGTEITGDYFISDIHPASTIEMIDHSVLRRNFRDRITSAENTKSVFAVYLTFKKDSVPYQRYNYYYHNDKDVWRSVVGEFGNSYLYMHQCDEQGQEFARSAMLMAIMDYSQVKKWEGVAKRNNCKDYKEFKEKYAEILISKLELKYPGIRENIESYYTSSPLTYLDYTCTPEGTIYGTALDVAKPLGGVIAHWTKLPNLLFVGQNTYAHGMLGVAIGAAIVCGEFLGLEKIINEIDEQ